MHKNKIKVIFFDVDGVIVNSEAIHQKAVNKIYDKYGIVEEGEDFAGQSFRDRLIRLKEEKNLEIDPAKVFDEKWDLFFEMFDETMVIEPTINFIREYSREYDIFFVTSGKRELVDKIIKLFSLEKDIKGGIGIADVIKPKPNPEPYEKALALAEVLPGEAIVVEDSPSGIRAAQSAGMKCAGLIGSYPREKINFADLIIDEVNMDNLETLLK